MAGYYKESITGIVDVATQDAISRYQADNNLIANGRIDFDLYHNMIVNKYIDGPIIPEDANNSIAKTNSSNRSNSIPVGTGIVINMSSNRGNAQSFSVGEMFQLTMSVSKSAFVYCYYQDTNGQVFRVFPNRFSPNAAIAAEQTIKVPPASLPFQLILDKPGNQERVDCIASRRELGINLPKDMLIDDLQPIPNRNIDNIIDEFRNLDEEIVYKTLRILVSN
jgi:peptidoglycan hydrolase-like protein with peptidoglycan-binding domain